MMCINSKDSDKTACELKKWWGRRYRQHLFSQEQFTVKILKFGTPQIIAIIVLKIEKFDVTLH